MTAPWSLLVVLFVIAWLTAGGMAVRSVSRIWLRHWAEQRLRGASAAAAYLARPHRLLAASGAGVAFALVVQGTKLAAIASPWQRVGALLVVSLIVIVFAQILPRAIARRWPTVLAPVVLPLLQGIAILTSPILFIGRAIASPWVGSRSRGATEDGNDRDVIQDLLREGELEGVGERDEIAIISGVVEFGEKTIGEIMTPRAELFALPATTPPRQLAEEIARAGYSRVPLFGGSPDDIVGMVHAFDVLKAGGDEQPPLRPVYIAAPGDPCNELLFRMLRQRRHLAIVRDADGHTTGLVSLEDLLEELVGDIRDEHDEPATSGPRT